MTQPETTERRRAPRHVWALALAAVLGLTAHDAGAQPKPVVVVQSGEAATLDWHMHCDKNAHEPDRQIFDTLLRRNVKTLQLEGNLAESWRLVNDTTWQFKLRRNVKFHNGEPFDAAAVKFSIERMLNPQQAAPGRTSIATIDHVEVVDPLTVNVITKAPFPLLPVRMSPGHCGTVGIVPPKYVAQVGDAGFAVKPVGTGPYKFVEWVKDDHVTLERWDRYFRPSQPYIDRIIFNAPADDTVRLTGLQTGKFNWIQTVPPQRIPELERARDLVLTHIVRPELQEFVSTGKASKITDYKSALQETLQAAGWPQPAYVLVRETGPEHKKTFTIEARLSTTSDANVEFTGRAEGPTKKNAEQDAARQVLEYLASRVPAVNEVSR
jgi:ABC-type transport system substrate-binding protein